LHGTIRIAIEAASREQIDALLALAYWHACDADAANIYATRGVANFEFMEQCIIRAVV